MKECGLCAVGGVGFFCCLCGTAFPSIQERIAHESTGHFKLEGHIPIRFTSTQVRVLLANSVQFELEIRTDVERSTGNTFLALVNSNNLRGMSVTVGLGKVITLSWFGNRSPNRYSTFPSCPICFAAGKWPVGGKKSKTNLDPKFQGMLGKCCVEPACHTYFITTDCPKSQPPVIWPGC